MVALCRMRIERGRNGWCKGRARRFLSIGIMLPAWIVTVVVVRSMSAQDTVKNNAMIAMLVLCLVTLICLGWSMEPPEPAVDRRTFDQS